MLDVYTACDPKLMPTFPQHRNLKAPKTATQAGASSSTQENANNSGEHSLHLPAISDLVIIIKIIDILHINRSQLSKIIEEIKSVYLKYTSHPCSMLNKNEISLLFYLGFWCNEHFTQICSLSQQITSENMKLSSGPLKVLGTTGVLWVQKVLLIFQLKNSVK